MGLSDLFSLWETLIALSNKDLALDTQFRGESFNNHEFYTLTDDNIYGEGWWLLLWSCLRIQIVLYSGGLA